MLSYWGMQHRTSWMFLSCSTEEEIGKTWTLLSFAVLLFQTVESSQVGNRHAYAAVSSGETLPCGFSVTCLWAAELQFYWLSSHSIKIVPRAFWLLLNSSPPVITRVNWLLIFMAKYLPVKIREMGETCWVLKPGTVERKSSSFVA